LELDNYDGGHVGCGGDVLQGVELDLSAQNLKLVVEVLFS